MTRYKRHIALNEIGAKGQSKINNTSVLVVGVGGLGSPVIEYLSRAGVGVIGIIDFDNVELSNLQRQIIFSEDDLNKNKAMCAQEYIKRINSSIKTIAYSEALTIQNGSKIILQYDIIVDGTDDVKIRYLLNDFCVLLDKPLVYAALYKFEGQISVFNYNQGPTYRCLFPIIPKEDELPNCSQTGVLGVVPGILGIYQANEVLK
ncbi:MAG: HesA/MoeB/ThiF family protein, partial [Marinoscillum sp.]